MPTKLNCTGLWEGPARYIAIRPFEPQRSPSAVACTVASGVAAAIKATGAICLTAYAQIRTPRDAAAVSSTVFMPSVARMRPGVRRG